VAGIATIGRRGSGVLRMRSDGARGEGRAKKKVRYRKNSGGPILERNSRETNSRNSKGGSRPTDLSRQKLAILGESGGGQGKRRRMNPTRITANTKI